MDRQMVQHNPAAVSPKLGATARAVWHAWKAEGYMGGTSVYGSNPKLGELCWQIEGLHRVVGPHLVTRLTEREEDATWDALVAGQLRIYRRRNAPLSGASLEPTQILHEADHVRIPTGLSGD